MTPQNKASTVKRDARGRIAKGSAAINPGGRPGWVAAITAQLEGVAPDAVQYLADVVRGKATTVINVDGVELVVTPTHENRIKASEIVLSFAVAKPKQRLELDGADAGGIVINVVKYTETKP